MKKSEHPRQREGDAVRRVEGVEEIAEGLLSHPRPEIYAPWNAASILLGSERKRVAARLMHRLGVFPTSESRCLEVGCGSLGWLGDLITWGVPQHNIHGIDLDPARIVAGKVLLPGADLRSGDVCDLPWVDGSFDLVVASTLFTSILDESARSHAASEIIRVLAPGGALLWYDFRVNSPRNSRVRKVTRSELHSLFPSLSGTVVSITLAPPLSRRTASWSWTLATILSGVPFLRTHLLSVLVKPGRQSSHT